MKRLELNTTPLVSALAMRDADASARSKRP
jgi:hypothetical protein